MDEEDKRKAEEATGSTPERTTARQEANLHYDPAVLQAFAKAPSVPAAMETRAKSAAEAIAAVAGTQLTDDTQTSPERGKGKGKKSEKVEKLGDPNAALL